MIRRLILLFQIRSLQIMIDGRAKVLHFIADPMTRANMEFAQDVAMADLRRLKREYQQ